ncbi:MAG TPA: hypothetical protein VLG46_09910 [Anaerolineae bacterium]|nr:hypothetical protein [Anaerolineae bacterium]
MIRCPQCGRRHPDTVITCDCGYDLQAHRQQLKIEKQSYQMVAHPFQWLPILQVLLQVMGVLCLIGGGIGAIALWSDEASFWQVILTLLAGGLIAVPYFASAEAINVLLSLSAQQPDLQRALRRIERALQKQTEI